MVHWGQLGRLGAEIISTQVCAWAGLTQQLAQQAGQWGPQLGWLMRLNSEAGVHGRFLGAGVALRTELGSNVSRPLWDPACMSGVYGQCLAGCSAAPCTPPWQCPRVLVQMLPDCMPRAAHHGQPEQEEGLDSLSLLTELACLRVYR